MKAKWPQLCWAGLALNKSPLRLSGCGAKGGRPLKFCRIRSYHQVPLHPRVSAPNSGHRFGIRCRSVGQAGPKRAGYCQKSVMRAALPKTVSVPSACRKTALLCRSPRRLRVSSAPSLNWKVALSWTGSKVSLIWTAPSVVCANQPPREPNGQKSPPMRHALNGQKSRPTCRAPTSLPMCQNPRG